MAPTAILTLVPPSPSASALSASSVPSARLRVEGPFSLLPTGGVQVVSTRVPIPPSTPIHRSIDHATGLSFIWWVGPEGEWRLELVRATERDQLAILRILQGMAPQGEVAQSIDARRRLPLPLPGAPVGGEGQAYRNSIVLVDEDTNEVLQVLPLTQVAEEPTASTTAPDNPTHAHAHFAPSTLTKESTKVANKSNSTHSSPPPDPPADIPTAPKSSSLSRRVDGIISLISPGLGTWTSPEAGTDVGLEVQRTEALNPDSPPSPGAALSDEMREVVVSDDALLYDYDMPILAPPPPKPTVLSRVESLVGLNPWVNAVGRKRLSVMSASSVGTSATGAGYHTALEGDDDDEGAHERDSSAETVQGGGQHSVSASSIYDVEPPSPRGSQLSSVGDWSKWSTLKTNATATAAPSPAPTAKSPSAVTPATPARVASNIADPESDGVLLQFLSSGSTIRARPLGLNELESGSVVPAELLESPTTTPTDAQGWTAQLLSSLDWASSAWETLIGWWWRSSGASSDEAAKGWSSWQVAGAAGADQAKQASIVQSDAPRLRAKLAGRGEWGAEGKRVSVMMYDENGRFRRAYVGR